MANGTTYSRQYELLKKFFSIVENALQQNQLSLIAYKCAGDSLMLSLRFHQDTFRLFQFPKSWAIKNQVDAVNIAAQFYCIILKIQPTPAAWNDLGIALLHKSRLTGSKAWAEK